MNTNLLSSNFSDMSETHVDRSALALVNGQLWDMERPLEEDCTVQLLHFNDEDPFHVNRYCSLQVLLYSLVPNETHDCQKSYTRLLKCCKMHSNFNFLEHLGIFQGFYHIRVCDGSRFTILHVSRDR